MSTLSIETSQNTFLNLVEASIGERIIAALFDLMIMAVYAAIGVIALQNAPSAVKLIYFALLMFYSLGFELIWGGTLGKKVLKLEIIHESGAPVLFVHSLLRWILRIVDVWLIFGAIGTVVIILSEKGQRLGDLAAGTLVVRSKKRAKKMDAKFTEVEESYVPVFEQARLLTDEDIRIVRETLAFVKEKGFYSTGETIRRTRSFIEKKMDVKSDLKNITFLETVVKDYYKLS
jgi:uncharacterized RDD family membrane protein YckC